MLKDTQQLRWLSYIGRYFLRKNINRKLIINYHHQIRISWVVNEKDPDGTWVSREIEQKALIETPENFPNPKDLTTTLQNLGVELETLTHTPDRLKESPTVNRHRYSYTIKGKGRILVPSDWVESQWPGAAKMSGTGRHG